MNITPFIANTTSAVASPSKQRGALRILNQSTTATVWIAFDQPAVAAPVAGQITIGALGSGGQDPGASVASFTGHPNTIPWQAIHIIASAANTPVTILE